MSSKKTRRSRLVEHAESSYQCCSSLETAYLEACMKCLMDLIQLATYAIERSKGCCCSYEGGINNQGLRAVNERFVRRA